MRALSSAALVLTFIAACKPPGAGDPVDAAASPQASAEPAPLANVATTDAAAWLGDGGPAPTPMRVDRALDPDAPLERVKDAARDGGRDTPRDSASVKDLTGFALQAILRPSDVPAPPKAAEVSDKGIEAARKKTESRLSIELSQTRARIVLASDGFVLPEGTEIRARVDRYGHVLILPGDADSYRVIAPGALRALIGERRLDVAPLAPAEVSPSGEGARRLNLRTKKIEVASRAAKATFEIAQVTGSGDGGQLLCRALLDLMNAPPSTPLCAPEDVPLHAELHWTTKGSIVFDALSIVRRFDLAPQQLAAPPATTRFVHAAIPATQSLALLSKADLAALRSGPIELPPPARSDAGTPAVESGLELVNPSDELRFAWIDGVPTAWVAPGARERLAGLQRGRYLVQWRTFLSDAWDPPELLAIPGTSSAPSGDAGAK